MPLTAPYKLSNLHYVTSLIGTPAVDWWDVTFGTMRRGLGVLWVIVATLVICVVIY